MLKGYLETIPHVPRPCPNGAFPPEMNPLEITPESGNAPVFTHVGPAWATLVGGRFRRSPGACASPQPKARLSLRPGWRSAAAPPHGPSGGCRLPQPRPPGPYRRLSLVLAHKDRRLRPLQDFRPPKDPRPHREFPGRRHLGPHPRQCPCLSRWESLTGPGSNGPGSGRGARRLSSRPCRWKRGCFWPKTMLSIKAVVCDHKIPSLAYALAFHMEIRVRKDRLTTLGLASRALAGPAEGVYRREAA